VGILALWLLQLSGYCLSAACVACGGWQLSSPFPPLQRLQWMFAAFAMMAAMTFFITSQVISVYFILDPAESNQ
jgi:hypothetical protein